MTGPMFGVYRLMANGAQRYVPRTATTSEKLAREIAGDLTAGIVVMPDGRVRTVRAYPHIAKRIEGEKR